MKYWFVAGDCSYNQTSYCGYVSIDPLRIQGLIDAFIFQSEGMLEEANFTVIAFEESDMLENNKARSVLYNKMADLFIGVH